MKQHTFTIFIIFIFYSLTLSAQTATSNTPSLSDTIELKETTIQAYRADKTLPLTFKNINKLFIDNINTGQEPSQILSTTPSIHSYSDAGNYQGYAYFRLRGIDQTRVNMTLDGIPLNEPEDQGVYFSNYPDFFNSVQSIQIQRGVGTTTNGVASYAGSINFQSPNLRDTAKTEIGGNYGSFNTYRLYGEYNSGFKENKALYFRLTHQGSDGYKFHSGNLSSSAFLSTCIRNDKNSIKLTGFIGNQKNELSWIGVAKDTIKAEPRTNGNANEDDNFTQSLLSLQHSWQLKPNIKMNTTVYYNYLDGNYDFDLNNFLGYNSTDEMYNYDFQHHFAGVFSNINWYTNHFKAHGGIHYNTIDRRHIGSERTLGKLYSNHGYKSEFSSFVKINYTIQRLNIFADVQYRHTDFDYTGSISFDKLKWDFINPKMGINYFIKKEINIYYSYGKCSREPTRNDIFYGEDNLYADDDGYAIYSDIASEQVNNHELGIKTQQTRWHLNANLYLMNFKNEIVLNGQYGPNGLALHSNVANSFRSGIEVDFAVKFPNGISYTNNSSISQNRISEEDINFEPILSPSLISNQRLKYSTKYFNAGINIRYQEQNYIDFENENKVPAFTTIDLLGDIYLKSLTIQFKVNNVQNKTSLTSGYMNIYDTPLYFVQAPINFNFGLKWIF